MRPADKALSLLLATRNGDGFEKFRISVCAGLVAAALEHEAAAHVPDWPAAIVPLTLYAWAAPLPVPPTALVPSTYCRFTALSVTVIVAAPGGVAAPVPVCSPNE